MSADRRAGFTLLETTIALGATAVVLVTLAVAVPTALRTKRGARTRLERATTARTVLLHLERALASALAEAVVVTPAPSTRLEFTGGGEPGERLAYTVDGAALVRRATPRFTTEPVATGVRVLGDVAALELRAFDGRDWRADWHVREPPEAVRIRIVFADGEEASTVAAIPIASRSAR